MKKIELGGKRGAGKYALVDDEDYELVSGFAWHLSSNGYARCAVNVETREEALRDGRNYRKQRRIFMHRLVMGVDDVPWNGISIDHLNRDKLDNRKSNLRIADQSIQCQNVGSNKNVTSQYRGVSWKKREGRWVAQGQLNGKVYWLGYHDDELEAARVARDWRVANYPDYHEPLL